MTVEIICKWKGFELKAINLEDLRVAERPEKHIVPEMQDRCINGHLFLDFIIKMFSECTLEMLGEMIYKTLLLYIYTL